MNSFLMRSTVFAFRAIVLKLTLCFTTPCESTTPTLIFVPPIFTPIAYSVWGSYHFKSNDFSPSPYRLFKALTYRAVLMSCGRVIALPTATYDAPVFIALAAHSGIQIHPQQRQEFSPSHIIRAINQSRVLLAADCNLYPERVSPIKFTPKLSAARPSSKVETSAMTATPISCA